jgi:quercetin dioxygenase-like cupin family protein
MNRRLSLVITLAVGAAIGVLGGRLSSAQEPLKEGKVLQRADIAGSNGMEAILVERDLPAGKESGKHTQSGTEIVYIADGSVIFEAAGQPAKTLTAGQAFSTHAGEVHNVKNASSTAPAKALAFYIAKKGAKLEDLSKPAK